MYFMLFRPDQHAIIRELKFNFCFMQFATGNWQLATCNLQLAACHVNRSVRVLVDFSCNYLVDYIYICYTFVAVVFAFLPLQ